MAAWDTPLHFLDIFQYFRDNQMSTKYASLIIIARIWAAYIIKQRTDHYQSLQSFYLKLAKKVQQSCVNERNYLAKWAH